MADGVGESNGGIEHVTVSLDMTKINSPQPKDSGTASSPATNTNDNANRHGLSDDSVVAESYKRVMQEQAEEEKILTGDNAVEVDLSAIRGIQPPEEQDEVAPDVIGHPQDLQSPEKKLKDQDLEALAELVPGLKTGKIGASAVSNGSPSVNGLSEGDGPGQLQKSKSNVSSPDKSRLPHLDSMVVNQGIDEEYEEPSVGMGMGMGMINTLREIDEEESDGPNSSEEEDEDGDEKTTNDLIQSYEKSAPANPKASDDASSSSASTAGQTHVSGAEKEKKENMAAAAASGAESGAGTYSQSNIHRGNPNPYHGMGGGDNFTSTPPRDSGNESFYGATPSPGGGDFHPQSSVASLSTATQSHEVRMPMYLPTFRPATGCTNASDYIVRCFVARLRAGITVVKHGRSRWCKSRLRVLHVHSDGRSLSWKPAQGEPTTNRRPPKLDLSTCLEVRHAWSPDPLNPMFTGTPILRAKCEAANAFKSFALIFPRRTVDITAVTADQCKVLMEGFSALCFRLQVANMAGRGAQGMVTADGDNKAAEGGANATAGMAINAGDPSKIPR